MNLEDFTVEVLELAGEVPGAVTPLITDDEDYFELEVEQGIVLTTGFGSTRPTADDAGTKRTEDQENGSTPVVGIMAQFVDTGFDGGAGGSGGGGAGGDEGAGGSGEGASGVTARPVAEVTVLSGRGGARRPCGPPRRASRARPPRSPAACAGR